MRGEFREFINRPSYKKVLYTIKKMKKCVCVGGGGGGGGRGAIFEPKTLSLYLKKEKELRRQISKFSKVKGQ